MLYLSDERLKIMGNYVTLVVAFSTCFIGIITSIIAYSQMKIASAKVKLDLYERRFNVYVVALNCYQSFIKSQFEELLNCRYEFTKICRESKFLFKENDSIYKILSKMEENIDQVLLHLHDLNVSNNNSSPYFQLRGLDLQRESDDAQKNFKKNLTDFEEKIKPYIQFENVKGWTFF